LPQNVPPPLTTTVAGRAFTVTALVIAETPLQPAAVTVRLYIPDADVVAANADGFNTVAL
jgi:hypothetical protein